MKLRKKMGESGLMLGAEIVRSELKEIYVEL